MVEKKPRNRRVLVTGSRSWVDRDVIRNLLTALLSKYGSLTVVHGKCPKGADAIASDWCSEQNEYVLEESHPAKWKTYGNSAGMRRNQEMVDKGADLCLAFIRNSSPGASHCADAAAKAHIRVFRIMSEEPFEELEFDLNRIGL